MTLDSYRARSDLVVGDDKYGVFRLDAVVDDPGRLPYSLRILLENLLRHEDGANVGADDIAALADRSRAATEAGARELQFMPARVLMQDFTGVPAIVDLAAMRDAMAELGGDPRLIEPGIPVDLVIDHSIVADVAGVADAFVRNAEFEFARNRERYTFLRWAQSAFRTLRVFPPNRGICHQVNLEYLAQVVFRDGNGLVYPDTLVGTDSHTPMVNGLGVLGWGVGGIEAEAAMLGQPLSMLLPRGRRHRAASVRCRSGATATDLVLTVARAVAQARCRRQVRRVLRRRCGPGARSRTGRRSATCRRSTARRARSSRSTTRRCVTSAATGRPDDLVALVETYAKEQGLWHDPAVRPVYDETISCSTCRRSSRRWRARPRPQDRVVVVGGARRVRAGVARVPAARRRGPRRRCPSVRTAPRPTSARSSRSRRAIRPRPVKV